MWYSRRRSLGVTKPTDVKAELRMFSTQKESMIEEIKKLDRQKAGIDTEVSTLLNKVSDFNKKLYDIQSEYDRLVNKNNSLKVENDNLAAAIEFKSALLQSMERDRAELRVEAMHEEDKIIAVRNEHARIRSKTEKLKANVTKQFSSLDERHQEVIKEADSLIKIREDTEKAIKEFKACEEREAAIDKKTAEFKVWDRYLQKRELRLKNRNKIVNRKIKELLTRGVNITEVEDEQD